MKPIGIAITLTITLFLLSCGGAMIAEGGTGGTGVTTGTVQGYGSLFVNDVEFDVSDAVFLRNGQPAPNGEQDYTVGEVVTTLQDGVVHFGPLHGRGHANVCLGLRGVPRVGADDLVEACEGDRGRAGPVLDVERAQALQPLVESRRQLGLQLGRLDRFAQVQKGILKDWEGSRYSPYWYATLRFEVHVTRARVDWCRETLKHLRKIEE